MMPDHFVSPSLFAYGRTKGGLSAGIQAAGDQIGVANFK
jgi:hypothetical protein